MFRKDHPLYQRYKGMKARCYNPNHANYKYYGGRGIHVCERWLGEDGFWNFIEDMGMPPTLKHSIERNNVNGNYSPRNCRWATKSEQAINTRMYKTNTSGYYGVSWNTAQRKWIVTIRINKKTIRVGYFRDIEEAARAYNEAAVKYHGAIAKLNNV